MDLVVGASTNAVNSVIGKLGSLLAQEYTLIGGVRDDIQYINDELASMQAFLTKLKRAPGDHDEQRQDWMKQVREVAYDIEDCVDNASHRLGGEPRGSGWKVAVLRAWYLLTTLYAHHCIATEIGNLKARAQHVSERRTRYGVENPTKEELAAGANAPRDHMTPPLRLIGTKSPVGIEDAMKELESWYAQGKQSAPHQPRFLAIVGFGGLGKTTLAIALYRKIGDEFGCKAFVLASQKFHLSMVLRRLIKQFHEQQQSSASKNDLDKIEEWGEEKLKNKLRNQLKDKRYLVLIDDIWSVSAWENIRDSLPKDKKGSTIILTTRFKSVSEACRRQGGYVYDHKPLLKDNSCKLFSEIISNVGKDLPFDTLIDDEIIMKTCGGLPLAIIVVAGLVASKLKSESNTELKQHLSKVGEELTEDLRNNLTTEGVTNILNHCYNLLPADLKNCLLYLSMFPKGCLISRKSLIRRWIAEGFITEKHGKTVEEVAEQCFDELITRNLIRAAKNSSNGKVKNCQVHDMILEYIVGKSSDENYITVVGGHWQIPFPSYKVRRLTIHKTDKQEKETLEKMKLSHVRSLTALGSFKVLHSTMDKFQILQVLDLEGSKDLSSNYLKKICNMHQLKFLSLRRTEIEKMPKEIGNLEYLEVLDIRETKVRKLPTSVEKLQRMAHLLAGNKVKRIALTLTEVITKMTSLETLSGVEISAVSTKEQGPLKGLENLTNLKKLTIYRLLGFTNGDNDNMNTLLLSAIEHLSSCSLKFLEIDDDFTGFLDSSLNASQAPPEHLHTLGLSGKLSQLPEWIGCLHNLEKLTLSLTSLATDILMILSELPELFSLIFSLDSSKNDTSVLKILHNNMIKSGGKIFVLPGGFGKLELLRFVTPLLPPLSFLEGAMPKLQRLELRYQMVEGVYGLENLESLQQVFLTVSIQAPEDAKVKTSQIKELEKMPWGKKAPVVVIDEYNESSKD